MFGEEKKEICGAETYYRELGYYQNGQRQFRRSFPAFDKAIEITPTDLRALHGRAWARSKSAHYKCAMDDINRAFAVKPRDINSLQLKALNLFLLTDFEDSFVQNIRGSFRRIKPDNFIMGARQCAEEVERCIGIRGGHALRDHFDIIRTIAWKKAIDLRIGKQWKPRFKKRTRKQKKTDNTPTLYTKFVKKVKRLTVEERESELSILESLADTGEKTYNITKIPKSKFQPPQRQTTNIGKVMAEKYLDKMCYDKDMLKLLKKDPRISGPNYAGTVNLRTLAIKGYHNVAFRQEILRIRKPYYSIKYNEIASSGLLLKRQEEELRKMQNVVKHDADTFIKLLRAAREAYLTNVCEMIANKAKTYFDKKTLKHLPDKEQYLKQIYDIIGLVYLDRYRLKEGDAEWDPIKRINFLFGLPISREPSQDSVIKHNKKEFMDTKQAILMAEDRLAKATTPLETVWHYYTLATLNLDLERYDLSRFYARKALIMAELLENIVWTTNTNMLITMTHVRQRNRNESKNELMKTLEYAQALGNKDIINYLTKCFEVVETIDFDDIRVEKVIQDREKDMVKATVDISMKKNIAHLFMKIDAIPASRRMSIMPGVRLEEETKPISRKMSSKPSIKPQSKVDIEFNASIKGKKGLQLLEQD